MEAELGYVLRSEELLAARFDIKLVKREHELELVYGAKVTNRDPALQQALLNSLQRIITSQLPLCWTAQESLILEQGNQISCSAQ